MPHRHDSTSRTMLLAARRMTVSALALLLLLTQLPAAQGGRAASAKKSGRVSERTAAVKGLEGLPLSFVPNAGQFGPEVKYHARGLNGSALFKPNEVAFTLPPPLAAYRPKRKGERRRPGPVSLRLLFQGARPDAEVMAQKALPGTVNYFIGSDPARWRASVPTYEAILYRQLYKGVDLRYDGAGGKLKSTYMVAPGADPSQIRWRYEGAASLKVDEATGDLRVALPAQVADGTSQPEVVERAPIAWQEQAAGRRIPVSVRFKVNEDGSVGFTLGAYERGRRLVIDPTYEFSYVLGGEGRDYGYSVALDAAGNIYLTGVTSSVSFSTVPALPGSSAQPSFGGKTDVFIIKLNPTGNTVLYSTYLGGGDDDWGFGVAVDAAGRAHVTGYTRSANFPVSNALQASYGGGPVDAFVAKLDADGRTLLYSTYLGGDDEEVGHSVVVSPDGHAAIAGYTRSANFPVTAGALQATGGGQEDGFVLKLRADGGALLYGSYLGGSADDRGQAIATDSAGNLYVAGYTASSDFPVSSAFQSTHGGLEDAFVLKLRPDGSKALFSTYLGGADSDYARALAVDAWGNIYLTGSTRSTNFPATAGAFRTNNAGGDDAFVAKLNRKGHKLSYATYLGGAGDDYGLGIAVDRGGFASVTGRTKSADFPLAAAFDGSAAGVEEAFATRLGADGAGLDFSTFIGGLRREIAEGIAADASGNLYVTGYTFSEDFPNTNLEPQRYATDDDAFVMKITAATPAPAPCSIESNVAHATSGATATASSTFTNGDFAPSTAIDGDRTGVNWGNGGGWSDGTRGVYPDWLEVSFDDVKTVSQIRVYTLQDGYRFGQEPTATTTAVTDGLIDFDVQAWDGSNWVTVPGGEVRGNALAMRTLTFPPLLTDRVRVLIRRARVHFSRVVEVEALGCGAP